jgi:hypothetical protein
MATFLKPDKTITTTNGLKIKQKIIPDSLVAEKDVASWIKKGQKMKPCKKLNNGTGKPLGVTVHNTGDIKVAAGTNAAEQYTRATYAGNMSGVVVHFYVWENEIWQNLNENERGWHATDGQTRRASQRKDGSKIGGNLDTIAIECIGNNAKSEDTTAKLVAYLCAKYDLNPATDVYQHNYFYPSKKCPQYIIPHWSTFLNNVKKYYNTIKGSAPAETAKPTATTTTPTQTTPKPAATTTTAASTHGSAGQQVKLTKTKVYASATAKTQAGTKTGTFYLWSNEVVNGRIRITIAANKAGQAGQVTGWINVSDINNTSTPAATSKAPTKKEYKKGDIVNFKGGKHYISSTSSVGVKCKAGKAKISNIKPGTKHPYHLIRVSGGGATVYGWVNAADFE